MNTSVAHSSKTTFQASGAHQTNTHLPNLHNVSTTSLLSNCHFENKQKQNSMVSNRSNYGSQKKLHFKVSSKTPTNYFVEKGSSSKKFSEASCSGNKMIPTAPLSDEEKLRRFHIKWEEHKQAMTKKTGKEVEIWPKLDKQ